MEQLYNYDPLPGDNYIRLATIHPGNFEDDIVVSFHTMPFPGPEYEALSYAWGSEENPLPVYVNSRDDAGTKRLEKIPTTQNLVIALKHLRNSEKSRVMWIDALCIHQADLAEKGPQVAKMGEIFRLAHRVVAWLGPEENDSNHAMNYLVYNGTQLQEDVAGRVVAVDACADPSLGDLHKTLVLDTKTADSISYLVSRPWFTRLWVRQEIFLANSNGVIMCGFWQVRWHLFRLGLRCVVLKRKEWTSNLDNGLAAHLDTIHGLLRINHGYTNLLMNYQIDYGNCQCSNPLDRLYAVLAIFSEEERAIIAPPDYNISYVELYTTVASRYISHFKSIYILATCELMDDGPCPSWVPNWSKPPGLSLVGIALFMTQNTSSQLAPWYEIPCLGVLRIMGVSTTTVKRHYQFPALEGMSRKIRFEKIRDVLSRINQDEQHTAEYYARVLFGNIFRPPSSDWIHLHGAVQAVELILSDFKYKYEDLMANENVSTFCLLVSMIMDRAQIIQTTSGYLGLASSAARAGDEICCVLGCNVPLLLRSLENGSFKLVGPCAIPELTNGGAFLGPLSKNIEMEFAMSGITRPNEPKFKFKDVFSGEITYEDPRLKSLALDPGQLESFRNSLAEDHNSK